MTALAEQTEVRLDAFYPHPREKVFAAFSNPQALSQWIAPADDIAARVTRFDFTPEGGFEIEFDMGPDTLVLQGQFTKIKAHDALSFTWIWQPPAPHCGVISLVSVRFDPENHGTRLSLTHSKLDAPGMAERHKAGWQGCFNRLSRRLEDTNA